MGAVDASESTRQRFEAIDGVRGVGAVTVVLYHFCFTLRPSWMTMTELQLVQGAAQVAVAVFFATSGFVLFRQFATARVYGGPRPLLPTYFARRALRIFPAYWCALAVFMVTAGPGARSGGTVAITSLLVQNYRAGQTLSGLGVSWTLVVELSFYLALPLLSLTIIRGNSAAERMGSTLFGLAVLFNAGVLLRAAALTVFSTETVGIHGWFPLSQLSNWLPGRLDSFALGMLLAAYSVRSRGRLRVPPPLVLRWLAGAPGVAWLGAALGTWASVQLYNNGPFSRPLSLFLATLLWTLCAALVLPACVFSDAEEGLVRRFALHPAVQFLGRVSFGIYIWHAVWMSQLANGFLAHPAFNHGVLVPVATLTALTLVSAWISYKLIEEPTMRWGRRLPTSAGRPAPTPVESVRTL